MKPSGLRLLALAPLLLLSLEQTLAASVNVPHITVDSSSSLPIEPRAPLNAPFSGAIVPSPNQVPLPEEDISPNDPIALAKFISSVDDTPSPHHSSASGNGIAHPPVDGEDEVGGEEEIDDLAADLPPPLHSFFPNATDQTTIPANATRPVRLAIIGGGLSGSSLAYFLSRTPPNQPLEITVFDTASRPGGRIFTVPSIASASAPTTKNTTVELGSSFFLADNHLLLSLAHTLNLPLTHNPFPNVSESSSQGSGAALWDGRKFVWRISGSTGGFSFRGWLRQAALALRYGIRTQGKVQKAVRKVLIHLINAASIPYADMDELVERAGLSSLLQESAYDYFVNTLNIPAAYVREVVGAATRGTIGMDVRQAHALGAMLSLAPLASVGLRGVVGGNQKMVRALLQRSKARFEGNTHVSSIKWVAPENRTSALAGKYRLTFTSSRPSTDPATNATTTDHVSASAYFDAVVLAAPMATAHMTLPRPAYLAAAPTRMLPQHTTLVHGLPRPEYFYLKANDTLPSSVITAPPQSSSQVIPFLSYTILSRYPDGSATVKIISNRPIPEENLRQMFAWWDPRTLIQRAWDGAWSDMSVASWETGKSGKVLVGEDFWYTSGVGVVADSMEASVIAAKNAHALLYRRFTIPSR